MADTIGWSCLAGTPVPRLGQGTWYLGEGGSPRKQELAALRTGVEAGMTLIDTAEMYGEGRSEKLVGEAIAPYDREKLFLVSKVYPWNAGEDQIFRSCENTLRRLKTDYLDMYLLHWRGSVPLEETAECMEELVRRGLIRQWGVSNLDKEDMEELWESGARTELPHRPMPVPFGLPRRGNCSASVAAAAQCISDGLLPSCAGRNAAKPTAAVTCIDAPGGGKALHRFSVAAGIPACRSCGSCHSQER